MLSISPRVQIPLTELEFTFARSGGPGGQNVNKVNSKAIMRWQVHDSPSLPEDVRQRFMQKFASRITTDGFLIVQSQKFRDQGRNVDSCVEKLREMVHAVVTPPTPRRPTKPGKAAKQRRVDTKREHSKKKAQRSRPSFDD